jgi:transketolase
MVATRDGYGRALVDLGKKNDDVIVLCCDLSESTRSHWFAEEFPDRFVQKGIPEQNMAGVAAGMALEGKRVFCSSYAVFNPGRNWDQVRVSVCYNNANVVIVGAHAGISVGPDGATHQALEDIASVRALPNLTILAPADYHETYKATMAINEIDGPVYLRFGRNKTPVFTSKRGSFKVGKADVLRKGTDVTIIACGPLVYQALLAAEKLSQGKKPISVEVINSHTIKPLDVKTIVQSAKKTRAVVSVEEHQVLGGLGGAVAEALAQNMPTPMEFVGMPNSFGESGEPDELLHKYGMTAEHIIKAIKKVIKRK